jgi:hypothetical protein
MEFRLASLGGASFCRGCVKVIVAEGEITGDTPDQFFAFANQSVGSGAARNVVFLDSPGGNVVGAMRLGKLLRQLGTVTVVGRVVDGDGQLPGGVAAARCMSACVYAFMGGRRRIVPPESVVGIHRMFREETQYEGRLTETRTVFASRDMVAALAQYSDSMGISPQLVQMAERISPQTVHVVTPSEMRRWRLGVPRF